MGQAEGTYVVTTNKLKIGNPRSRKGVILMRGTYAKGFSKNYVDKFSDMLRVVRDVPEDAVVIDINEEFNRLVGTESSVDDEILRKRRLAQRREAAGKDAVKKPDHSQRTTPLPKDNFTDKELGLEPEKTKKELAKEAAQAKAKAKKEAAKETESDSEVESDSTEETESQQSQEPEEPEEPQDETVDDSDSKPEVEVAEEVTEEEEEVSSEIKDTEETE